MCTAFTEATVPDGYIVHEYAVSIADENKEEVYKDEFIASYYITDSENTQGFTVSKDILQKGKTYTLTIKAESAYHRVSEPVSIEFTV
jgi:hypothetical protein